LSKVICIAGESGSGKTTAMRNLDPKSTYYFDCDKKGLSWKGWKNQYNSANKNYKATSDAKFILPALRGISEKSPQIKVIIIDTINGIMIDDEFDRAKEKGYDKWQDLAASVWGLVSEAHNLRDDLAIIFTAHTQTERDDSGFAFTRIRTSGKKLDKIVLESKFTTVLIAKAVDGKYMLETHAKNSTAKSPMGSFTEDEIPNDIVEVLKKLEEY
jgi:hypothetical protein